jgi:hypothetical protein
MKYTVMTYASQQDYDRMVGQRGPPLQDSTKNSRHWRPAGRAREHWPNLAEVRMRYCAGFPGVDGVIAGGGPAIVPAAASRLRVNLGLRHPSRLPSLPRTL